jgi:hypothetical protein
MKTLVLATMLAAASPAASAEPTDDAFECRKFGQDIVDAAIQARETGTTRADFLKTMGLMDIDDIAGNAQVPATIKIILDSGYLLYIWPLDSDPGGEVARDVMASLCLDVQLRRHKG